MSQMKRTPGPTTATPRFGTKDSKIWTFHSEYAERPDMKWMAATLNSILHSPPEYRSNLLRIVRELLYFGIPMKVEDSENSRSQLVKALYDRVADQEGKDIWELRAASALMLGATYNKEALPMLLNQFEKEENENVRECIIAAIGKIGFDSELVRQFTVNMLLQYYTLTWEQNDTMTSYLNSLRTFLYSPGKEISISLFEDISEGMIQDLLEPTNGPSGEDNWQLRAASALFLGAGLVREAVPALIQASTKDRNESVRAAAYSAALRILKEFHPTDARRELERFLAPAKGERGFDEEMSKVARRLFDDIYRFEGLRFKRNAPPLSIPIITLNPDEEERLKGYLKLARGKGVQTSDHNYFHLIVKDIGLERAIKLIMGGECVNLTEENISYVQNVVSKIAAAASTKEGSAAYAKVVATLSTLTMERVIEFRKAKKEATNLSPHYVPDSEAKHPRPKRISADEEKKLLIRLRNAYDSNDYSLVVREAGALKCIHVFLNSELLNINERTLTNAKKIIHDITMEAIKQRGAEAFEEVASPIIETYIYAKCSLFDITEDLPVLEFANALIKMSYSAEKKNPFWKRRSRTKQFNPFRK